jgi:hypothetical protein
MEVGRIGGLADLAASAAAFEGLDLSAETLGALNHRLDGWPIVVQPALVSARETGDSEYGATALRPLHRAAAAIWHLRGDLNAACRQLTAIGDVAETNNLDLGRRC